MIRLHMIFIGILFVALLAVGCTSRNANTQPTPHALPTVTKSAAGTLSPCTSTSVTGMSTAPSSVNTDGTASSTWSTFTNPQGLYSIRYPRSLDPLGVEYVPDEATLFWQNSNVDMTVEIGTNVIPISGWNDLAAASLAFQSWLAKRNAPTHPDETLNVDGMDARLYLNGWNPGQTDAFLLRPIPGSEEAMIYSLSFICAAGDGQCTLPLFWRQMLLSFQSLPIGH